MHLTPKTCRKDNTTNIKLVPWFLYAPLTFIALPTPLILCIRVYYFTDLLRTPPSNEAFRHSGCDSRLLISPTVTLYFDVELRRDKRPGTEQNTSEGCTGRLVSSSSLLSSSSCLYLTEKNEKFSYFTNLVTSQQSFIKKNCRHLNIESFQIRIVCVESSPSTYPDSYINSI